MTRYSAGVRDAFLEKAEELKLDIVDKETFKDDSATSFTNQLTKAKNAGATLILRPDLLHPCLGHAHQCLRNGLRREGHGLRRYGRHLGRRGF
ncbi:MAG: hypothetical protein ACLTSX_08720 [Collinsella sp.]